MFSACYFTDQEFKEKFIEDIEGFYLISFRNALRKWVFANGTKYRYEMHFCAYQAQKSQCNVVNVTQNKRWRPYWEVILGDTILTL